MHNGKKKSFLLALKFLQSKIYTLYSKKKEIVTTWSNIRIGITKGFSTHCKVQIFWEGQTSTISFKFCGLLRISEL